MRFMYAGLSAALCCACAAPAAQAMTTVFFDPSLTASNTASGDTSDTIACRGYVFTYSVDKWWYPGINIGPGTPTGRLVMVSWPDGIEAQAITASPTGPVTSMIGADITIKRVDGAIFDIASFTAKILGSTAGAGAMFEIMPLVNGEDAFPNPVMFNATGYAGQSFSYNTPALSGYDTYKIHLWMDFALTALTLVDTTPEPPTIETSVTSSNSLRIAWPASATGYVLQVAPGMPLGQFTSTSATPVLEGDFQVVYWPMTNSQCLFRLAH